MTDPQLLILTGIIWIAPHCDRVYCITVGCVFLIAAACQGLGWI
jgi:hypothetical protein